MASEVEICKRALAYIRARSINSLEDQTIEGGQCRLFYPMVRDQALSLIPWSFTQSQKTLALRSGTIHGYLYIYDYPNDCLQINELFASESPIAQFEIPYKVMNIDGEVVIVSNYQNLIINYTMKVENPRLFPILFQSALSHLLASEIAIPIIGTEKGNALRMAELQLYNQIINKAMAEDANQSFDIVPKSEFIQVRDNHGTSTEEFFRG